MTDCISRRFIANAQEDLEEIAGWWDELLEDRFPGTRRRWHQRRNTPDQAAANAAQDHADRAARFGTNSTLPTHLKPAVTSPPGATPAPGRVDVLDAIVDVTWGVIELRDWIAETMNADRRKIGVAPACRWIASAVGQLSDPELIEHTVTEARRLVGIVRAGTGRVEDVIELDADCPICGRPTLQAYAARMTVACIADECRCDSHDCPCQQGRRHTWAEHDLVWLARLIGEDDTPAVGA
jgi:hypothetical protein